MTELITALLTYGPLGVFCAILWVAYQKEKEQHQKTINALNAQIQSNLENHSKHLDSIREAQTEREREVSDMLRNYGNSVVTAVEHTHELAERLWGIRK